MSAVLAEEKFLETLHAGRVAFFAGSGISSAFPSCLPTAWHVLRLSSNLFLPSDEPALTAQVVDEIQPEIFYEVLMMLVGDVVVEPWKIIEPATFGMPSTPTLAHYLLVHFSYKAGVPLITTNFDTLFERAAQSLGVPYTKHLPPGPFVYERDVLSIWKVHGSIDELDSTGRPNILTTMARITQPNIPLLNAIHALLRHFHVCLIGYSGRDIDLFPYVSEFSDIRSAFWIDPLFAPGSDSSQREQLFKRAGRLRASTIDGFLDQIIGSRAPQALDEIARAGINPADLTITADRTQFAKRRRDELLEEHEARLRGRVGVDPATATLLLGLCLNRVGRHSQALRYLDGKDTFLRGALNPTASTHLDLLLARLTDCCSDYDRSKRHAAAARRRTRQLVRDQRTLERIALRVQALHAHAMASKLALGPEIRYGSSEVDFSPPIRAKVLLLVAYFWAALRMRIHLAGAVLVAPLQLRRLSVPESSEDVQLLRGWYWYLDHKIIMYSMILSAFHAAGLGSLVFHVLGPLFRRLSHQASVAGDAFTLGNSYKYLHEIEGISSVVEEKATSIYTLINDPINEALVHRNVGNRFIRDGWIAEAEREFHECLRLAERSSSYATVLKAIVALYVCDGSFLRDKFEECKRRVTGRGYVAYMNQVERAIGDRL